MYKTASTVMQFVHVRFDGRSWDLPAADLHLTSNSPEAEVRAALARFLDVAPDDLRYYVLERHANGNMTLRPEAVFG